MSTQLNEMVPGISRGVIGKKGDHVDGIYNQDLAENMVLIELGGIENTQEEINRTISLLAKVITIILQNPSSISSISVPLIPKDLHFTKQVYESKYYL